MGGKRQKDKNGVADYSIIVCGDFNSQGTSATREILVNGVVDVDFREGGDPTEKGQEGKQVTSRKKKQEVGTFVNAAEFAYGAGKVPATMLVANISSKMMTDDLKPTPELTEKVNACFDKFSAGKDVMNKEEWERWLLCINKVLGRGSEFRFAMSKMEARGSTELTREDFMALYVSELEEGKYWGVEHDIREILGQGLAVPSDGPTELFFDYIYYANEGLQLKAVQEPLTAEQKAKVYKAPYDILPNEWHPSDHLPVAAVFDFI